MRDTIESVMRQSYTDWELVVVDGASSDNTIAVIDEYRGRLGDRLKVVSEPDNGIYDAMNKGIALSTGEVLGVLNSDDFYTTDDVLERVAERMGRDDIDAVYGDVHYVEPGNLKRSVRYYSSRPFRRWTMRYGLMPAHPSFYCRREIYDRYGNFNIDYKVAADFELLLRLIFVHRISTEYMPMDFVTMRTGGNSTSGWGSHKRIMLDHRKALKANGVYSNVLMLSFRYLYKAWELIKS